MAKKICATPGCRGLGHARGYEHPSHDRFSDCPYAPQNISNDSLKPDRLNSLRGLRRSLSTESENRMEVEDPELGRGNRKRKKRKFFDDDHHNANNSKTVSNGFHQNVIRNDVFTPDYLSQAEFEQQWDQNASFLKPMTQSYNSEMVRNWSPSQVAKFILSLPKFQQSDMTKLEMKVIEEELDGEAFLLMTQNDFVKMLGLKLGPAIKIYNALLLIKKASS